ncbi:MAG: bifunctional folylpolyglutamate synthase/dihydrofolate synthase [Pyrinomonadaceae bacterium]
MNFREAQEYLESLGYERSVRKFGLENTYALLNALDHPERSYRKVQIVGTNGKGSTCAFLEAICKAANIKCGVTTSPHLISVTERIRINGEDISEKDFAEYVTRLRAVAERLVSEGVLDARPTFFEHITAIALLVFAERGVDIAILEAGLGGRFDSTTAAQAEIIGVSPIGLDHTSTLGNTLALIAAEKAAAFRAECEVAIAHQAPEALNVIRNRAEECGAITVYAENSIRITETGFGDKVSFESNTESYSEVSLSLKGKHQRENACTAILLAQILRNHGFEINRKEIIRGLETAVHRGRLEFENGILFDGAHNSEGAAMLREYLLENVSKPKVLVFGMVTGKNSKEAIELLFPLAEKIVLTTPNVPRALPASDLAELAKEFDVVVTENAKQALRTALKLTKEVRGSIIVVTGSLYLIGEIKSVIQKEGLAG